MPVKVALVWSDYPTTLPAAKDLVNDLDLTVTGPDGKVYHGNQFDTTGFSTPRRSRPPYDSMNNVEVVNIKPSATGLLKIAVNGSNVPDGPQPFALVINGAVVSQDAAVNFPMSITQEGGAVTLSANFSLGDTPMVKKPVTFYDQTGTGTPVKKGTVLTNALGVATLKFTAAIGTHTAYATTPAITAIGITLAPSTPAVPYTIGKVQQTSPGAGAVVNDLAGCIIVGYFLVSRRDGLRGAGIFEPDFPGHAEGLRHYGEFLRFLHGSHASGNGKILEGKGGIAHRTFALFGDVEIYIQTRSLSFRPRRKLY